MADPTPLNRNQIARFVGNDPDAIRAIERLFQVAGQLTPAEIATLTILIEAAAYDAGVANNKAESYQPNFQKLDYIDFNNVGPSVGIPRRIKWNDGDGTLDINMGYDGVVQQVGLESYYRIKADSTITNGQLVMFTGAVGASGVIKGAPSATGLAEGLYIMGVATMDIPNNEFGYVTNFGLVRGINTTGASVGESWSDGDILYYNPSYVGGMTNVRPTSPAEVVVVASVINAGPGGSGSLFVRISFYPRLTELSNVYSPSPSDGDTLEYDSGNARWQNVANSGRTSNTLLWLECY